VTAAGDNGCVELTVRDTGRGITPENLRNIFRPFFTTKTGKDRPAEGSGSGVGLAFCRRIVEAHDGQIAVESTPGQGTVFTVRLPKVPAYNH
jgi:signal transduction histidine kinase